MRIGLDYFPLDTTNDEKLDLFQAQYKAEGLGVLFQLFREIYGRFGYYLPWSDDMALLLSSRIGVEPDIMRDMVETALQRSIFSREKLDRFSVLTSRGIQKRYFEAAKRRRTVDADENLLMIPIESIYENADIHWVNCNETSEQVKAAELSAAEHCRETYLEAKKEAAKKKDGRTDRGAYGYVRLSDREERELIDIYGASDYWVALTYVDEYCNRNKNKYGWKDWKSVIARAIDQGWGKDENGDVV